MVIGLGFMIIRVQHKIKCNKLFLIRPIYQFHRFSNRSSAQSSHQCRMWKKVSCKHLALWKHRWCFRKCIRPLKSLFGVRHLLLGHICWCESNK